MTDSKQSKLIELSNQFYTNIPQVIDCNGWMGGLWKIEATIAFHNAKECLYHDNKA